MEKRGVEILKDRTISKSTAFTREDKEKYGLRGLLPFATSTQEKQKIRVIENIRNKDSNIEKYIFLSALADRNERLFYRLVIDYLPEILPIIYTPTVGEVCLRFSHIYRIDKGFYITPEDKGHIASMFDNWPEKDVRVIVVTDGSRILGLGDLGCNGMGIPIGKLSLYTAGGGIYPEWCLPVMFDMGTNNTSLHKDIMYLGYPHLRSEGAPYDEMMEEFVMAVQEKFPKALIQFEDFITPMAYKILDKYRDKVLCFNDDIQGTAAVALGGVLSSTRLTNIALRDSNIMFLGAGSAATGIADLMLKALVLEGLTETEAYSRLTFIDIHGLLTSERTDLMSHNLPYAKKVKSMDFVGAIRYYKPNILIGASGAYGTFTEEVVKLMTEINQMPVIFALSNPTSKAECTAIEAYSWSEGKVVFASGSPFDQVKLNGRTFDPGQANNVYIFPGIGLGALAVQATNLPESVFLVAASELAAQVNLTDLLHGNVYPKLTELRAISFAIAVAVAKHLMDLGLSTFTPEQDVETHIATMIYDPSY